jgi:hypothetical protein
MRQSVNFPRTFALYLLVYITSCNSGGGSKSTSGFVAAQSPIISPTIAGDVSAFDNQDNEIFFAWKVASDPASGIRDYTVHRFEMPGCVGLSIDTATIRGTSLPFEGTEGKTYSFKVTAYNNEGIGLLSECSNDLTIDTISPDDPRIFINGEASHTSDLNVMLSISASDASEMYITNTFGCEADGQWERFNPSRKWTLPFRNAENSVYVAVKDRAGNLSYCISKSIIHDNIAPDDPSLMVNAGDSFAVTTNVNLVLAARDATEMYISNSDKCDADGKWEIFRSEKSWALPKKNSANTVSVKFRDEAGNVSSCVSDSIIHDDINPGNTSLSINSGALYTKSSSVSLTFSAKDATEMLITNVSGCLSGGTWRSYSTFTHWTIAQSNGAATVYVKFRDAAGNESACIDDSIIHDSLPPSATSISVDRNPFKSGLSAMVVLRLAATNANEMYITNTSDCSSGGVWESFVTIKQWSVNQLAGVTRIYVKFRDAAGNESICITGEALLDWYTAALPLGRTLLAAATAGSKAIFAGGFSLIGGGSFPLSADIYDSATDTWSSANLSQARLGLTATSIGSKAFFAGGINVASSASNVVDIYDSAINTWSTKSLSQGRSYLASAALGNKVFFAGGKLTNGSPSNIIDIYDATSDTWTTATLSLARYDLQATTVGSKVFFAGGTSATGVSSVVDIYDLGTDSWTTGNLSQARTSLAATSVGDKAIFAGGHAGNQVPFDAVDIYDSSTNSWSTATISKPRFSLAATTVGMKAIFAGGGYNGTSNVATDVVDIYDATSNSWSTTTISVARRNLAATSVGAKAIFAGGQGVNYSNAVDLYSP